MSELAEVTGHPLLRRVNAIMSAMSADAVYPLPTRLELSAADWTEVANAISAWEAPGPWTSGRVWTRINTPGGVLDMVRADSSSLCFRRPGRIGRYEVVPWQRIPLL